MSSRDLEPTDPLNTFYEDEVLLQRCLVGEEKAWSILVRKYGRLIFSIAIRRGLRGEDASDVFQSVWVSLLDSMANIREPRALAAWLIRTTAHACDKLQLQQQRWTGIDREHEQTATMEVRPDQLLDQLQHEELVRQAVGRQSPECQKLIRLLFFKEPPVAYETAAAELGLAKGSIGATRMRCLEKLRRSLEEEEIQVSTWTPR